MTTHKLLSTLAPFLFCAAIVTASHARSRARHGSPVAASSLHSTVATFDAGDVDDATIDLGELMPVQVITVSAPRRELVSTSRSASKRYVCGAVEPNLVGGSQRTCEWVRQ